MEWSASFVRYGLLGLNWDNGKGNGNYYSILRSYWGYMGIMEKKTETTYCSEVNVLEQRCWWLLGALSFRFTRGTSDPQKRFGFRV